MARTPLSLVWLRRDLRLHDHAALYHALQYSDKVQPLFIFDTDILAQFPARRDRRVSFIARTLVNIHQQLRKQGGGLLVLHGRPAEMIPKLTHLLSASHVVAAEDYEAAAIARDKAVASALHKNAELVLVKDQVIIAPHEITRDGQPYKVFTPYANRWRERLNPFSAAPYPNTEQGRFAAADGVQEKLEEQGVTILDVQAGAENMLNAIGYEAVEDTLWPMEGASARLSMFAEQKALQYADQRDMVAQEGTSRLSPYLRFGLVSVRQCVGAAIEAGSPAWLNELIWREFYAMILYHFPESATTEWNPKYRGKLAWSQDGAHFKAWCEGKTGYPLVDAAMRQLLVEGWMHNRARMVVASFLTKQMQIDWRLGEAHFAQHLMDYDQASNVGGWQWAASTGTDAQPYFRVFNPVTQSRKFDPEGAYIRRYVQELSAVTSDAIHAPWEQPLVVPYYAPVVDLAAGRVAAIAMFKSAAG